MRCGTANKLLVVILCVCTATAAPSAERIIYVDAAAVGANDGSSWEDACVFLQDALTAASGTATPVEIQVAQGIYRPDQGADPAPAEAATFQLLNGVALRGGYAGLTGADPDARDVERYASVLSGPIDPDPDARRRGRRVDRYVAMGSGTDGTAVLDGFAIMGGNIDGMFIEAGSPALTNCTFADSYRYGLEMREGSSPSVTGCKFVHNGGAGIYAKDCNFAVADCLFERNGQEYVSSGGIACTPGDLVVTDCTFRENEGGAVRGVGTFDLFRCSFIGNIGGPGGAVHCSGNVTARQCCFRSNTGSFDASGTAELVDCEFTANSSRGSTVYANGEVLTATRCSFIGNSGGGSGGGAIDSRSEITRLSNCIFMGNTGSGLAAGAVRASGAVMQVSNCTFAGNRGLPNALDFGSPPLPRDSWPQAELTQCIIQDGPDPFTASPMFSPQVAVNYSNVQGGYPGEGNIDIDPCFVVPGYWDTSGTPDDQADDVWVPGDYHLKSQAGHWDGDTETWILDDVTSPCIDAGDPNGFLGSEPFPNGGFVNMGAYGGTREASRSYFGEPVCENQLAGDINGDCKVDLADMDILLSHWLAEGIERVNMPPSVTLTSPADGADLTYPEPIILRVEASDLDGSILYVHYSAELVHDEETSQSYSYFGEYSLDPTNGWESQFDWSKIKFDGICTITAEVVDNEGATTISSPVTIALHPAE